MCRKDWQTIESPPQMPNLLGKYAMTIAIKQCERANGGIQQLWAEQNRIRKNQFSFQNDEGGQNDRTIQNNRWRNPDECIYRRIWTLKPETLEQKTGKYLNSETGITWTPASSMDWQEYTPEIIRYTSLIYVCQDAVNGAIAPVQCIALTIEISDCHAQTHPPSSITTRN